MMENNFLAIFFLIISIIIAISGLFVSIRVRRNLPLFKGLKASMITELLFMEMMVLSLTVMGYFMKPDTSIENLLFIFGFLTLIILTIGIIEYALTALSEKTAKESKTFREITKIVEKIERQE